MSANESKPPIALAPPCGAEAAPAWLESAIVWARERRATDLHFFPGDDDAALWARIDGELVEAARYAKPVHARLVARLKVMGRCPDYDGGLVQEGRFPLNGALESGEARLSVMRTLRGDKAVIRLLSGGALALRLDDLGLAAATLAALREAMARPQGMLLAVGPSGCGKSTALYALLRDLSERAGGPVSVVTVEDPVEQTLPFAAQVNVERGRGLGFAECLRALLRQDPEVVMIGEIRDAETATAAIEAALTGHRMISSMHTLAAAEALVRLRQMGSPAYAVASAIAGILNLRLARTLCDACRRSREMTDDESKALPEAAAWPDGARIGEAAGCEKCLGAGLRGRTAIGELARPTEATADALAAGASAAAIATTLEIPAPARATALAAIRAGRLSLAEMMRLQGLASIAAVAKD